MHIFKDMDQYDFSEPPVIGTLWDNNHKMLHLPKYIISLYIKSTYDHKFDINQIYPVDFCEFLMFIDQYPTNQLSIDLLEKELIIYMDLHKIIHDEYIFEICNKYQLKFMYIYLHQKSLS